MNKTTLTNCRFSHTDLEQAKLKVLNWIKRFDTFSFLDSQGYQVHPPVNECIAGAGVRRSLRASSGTAISQLQEFIDAGESWLFGHLGYDLKNEVETLHSDHPDGIGFPDLFFYEPGVVIRISSSEMIIYSEEPEKTYGEIMSGEGTELVEPASIPIESRMNRQEYLDTVRALKAHIHRGDCYEINFCQEFFARDIQIHPVEVFRRLSRVSPNPFSALYRLHDKWLICASPERFIKKEGSRITSQPIKGTSPRVPGNSQQDDWQKQVLYNSAKERSENVMIVDLVRNDLSKICEAGTVKVDELFGIYSFPQVHQMISTVSGILRKGTRFSEVVRAGFPMGSMTGAPKKKVMELIEKYERTKRGLFSGALGYIEPGGDFDFNVVIRSILYNSTAKYLSFQAGSGITFYSDPEKEWEECLVKAAAIKKVLEITG